MGEEGSSAIGLVSVPELVDLCLHPPLRLLGVATIGFDPFSLTDEDLPLSLLRAGTSGRCFPGAALARRSWYKSIVSLTAAPVC